MPCRAAFLVEQSDEQMRWFDHVVVTADSKALCILQRQLEFGCEFLRSHSEKAQFLKIYFTGYRGIQRRFKLC
jgi:hypothetical protein